MRKIVIALLFLLKMFFGIYAQSPYWELVTAHADFFPRDGAGPFVFDNKMWLVGGWNEDSVPQKNSEVWNSSDGVNWNIVNTAAPWPVRHCMGTVVYKDKMWIIGGDGYTDVWNSEDGLIWNEITDRAPWGKRYKPYVLVFHDTIWLMGGFDYFNGNDKIYNDVWYSTDGAEWVLATSNAGWPGRGIIHGKVVFDDKIWILGGGLYVMTHYFQETYYNDVWNSADGIHWTRVLEHAPWIARLHHSTEVIDGKMWVMAGHNKRYITDSGCLRNDVWFSSDGISWTELQGTPWMPTHAASIYVYNNALWLAAGYLRNEVWKLNCPEVKPMSVHPGDIYYAYPNPASDFINIIPMVDSAIAVSAKVQIYNGMGNLVFESSFSASKDEPYRIDISGYVHGIYYLRLTAADLNQIIKFIVL